MNEHNKLSQKTQNFDDDGLYILYSYPVRHFSLNQIFFFIHFFGAKYDQNFFMKYKFIMYESYKKLFFFVFYYLNITLLQSFDNLLTNVISLMDHYEAHFAI